MSIKMIAVDLDDTLFRNDKTVSDRTVSALKKCREKGIKVVYATARGQSVHTLISPDLFDGFVRTNGAVAIAGDITVYSKLISTVKARNLLITADNAGIPIVVELKGLHYSNFNVKEIWNWLDHSEISDFGTLDVEAEKIYALPKTKSETKLLENNLPKDLRLISTRHNFTMIMHEDAGKYNAVAALAKYWGIKSAEIAAFGDDVIDMCMLEYCGIGIAMGNATDEVKSIADYICDTNENDGVTKWIEEHVL